MSENLFHSPYLEFTPVRNVIVDQVMPALSSDAWKVLCVALRLTWGGDVVAGSVALPPRISISEFVERTGIIDRAAVESAAAECVDAGCLVVPESDEPVLDFVLNIGPMALASSSPTEADTPADERIAFPRELEPALDALVSFAREMDTIPDPKLVQQAVIESGADAVAGWIAAGRMMMHLESPARYQIVMDRLLQGVPPLPLSMLEFEDESLDDVSPAAEAPHTVEASASEPDVSELSAEELWQTALTTLKTKMRSSKYKFLAPTDGIALEDNVLTVGAANERVREWLESGQLAPLILETFQSIAGESMTLKFVIQEK